MIARPSVQYNLEKYIHNFNDGHFIYPMWAGYKNQPGKTKDFLDFITSKGMPITDIHTSGHADLAGLRRMVEATAPKNLVPIHTFGGDEYVKLFPETNVVRARDGEEIRKA
ncbi:MAG: hypothetical protein LBC62_08150 [Treponema sp.]|jgi:ribonuclease J|nr:hypothetical protein [Treponema sp.]